MPAGRPRRKPLTRAEVVDAALRIADSEGLAALTMRRLAVDLGIEAASLYHYVPSRDALLDDLVSKVRAEIVPPQPIPSDWRELFEAIFVSYATALAAHPNLMSLAGRSVDTDPSVNGLDYLVGLGFSADDAIALWQSIHSLVIGFAVLSAAGESLVGDQVTDEGLRQRGAQWRLADLRRALRAILQAAHPADG